MSHVDDGALHAYLDGELSPVERERLEAHLADCAPCRARLDEERGLIERASQLLGLASPPERAAPPPLHQLRHPRLVWRLRMPLAWAATVVLAVGFGYFLGGTTDNGGPPVASSPSIHGLTGGGPLDSSAPSSKVALEEGAVERRAPETAPARARAPRPAARQEVDQAREAQGKLADQATVNARVDSAATVAEAAPAPEPRAAAPPLHLDAVVVTGQAAVGLARDRLAETAWPIVERDAARALLGTDLVGVPGLPIRELRRSPAGDGVLVEQQLDSATVIQLFQWRIEAERQAAPAAGAARAAVAPTMKTERLARFIGSLRVEIAGPLPADSLSRLLERVKPIP